MTYVERLLGEQGQAHRRLGDEILQQMSLEAMHAGAEAGRGGVRTSTAVPVHGAAATWDAAVLKTGAAGCQFCSNNEPAARAL